MKHVLYISYLYPPCNASGSKRLAGIAKYLPRYGWQPVILTRKWTPANCSYDENFLTNLPEFDTVTCSERAEKWNLASILKRKLRTLLMPTKTPYSWFVRAREEIDQIFIKTKIDAIFASYAPYAPLELAAYASRKFNVPWVADFRDTVEQSWMAPRLLRRRFMYKEKQCVASAQSIVTVSEGLRARLAERYTQPIFVVPHGYDSDEMNCTPGKLSKSFTISYTGTIVDGHQNAFLLLDAVDDLIKCGRLPNNSITVQFFKKRIDTDNGYLENAGGRYPFLKVSEFLPRIHALEHQRSSTILLSLTDPTQKGIMTGKIFEYLAAARPILAIPNDHDCIDALLAETKAGVCCTSKREIQTKILDWYREWRQTGNVAYNGSPQAIRNYSFDANAKQLTTILDGRFTEFAYGTESSPEPY